MRVARGMRRLTHKFRIGGPKLVIDRRRQRDARLTIERGGIDFHNIDPPHHRVIRRRAQSFDVSKQRREREALTGPGPPQKADRERRLGVAMCGELRKGAQRGRLTQSIAAQRDIGREDAWTQLFRVTGRGRRAGCHNCTRMAWHGRKAWRGRFRASSIFIKIARIDIGHVAVPFKHIHIWFVGRPSGIKGGQVTI